MASTSIIGKTTAVLPNTLHTFHRNPRQGDIAAIAASLRRHSQYKPITVNLGTHTGRPNEVLAGNHTLLAFRQLGEDYPDDKQWHKILVFWVDVDNDTADRIVVADNQTGQIGGFDNAALTELLKGFGDDIEGLGFTDADIADLIKLHDDASSGNGEDGPAEPPALKPEPLPRYDGDQFTLHHGDSLDVLKTLADNSVDAVVTDPPYGLEFMGKDWDAPWKAAGKVEAIQGESTDVSHPFRNGGHRVEYGINGSAFQDWCQQWATECLRILRPGGHMLAFGGTRTWHRLAVAVENAGFEIRDNIAWLYGSGFPKSLNVTEAMEQHLAEGSDTSGPAMNEAIYAVTAFLKKARNEAGWTNQQIDDLFGNNGMAGHWTTQASQPQCPSPRQWAVLKAELKFPDSPEMDALVDQLGATERPEDWGAGDGEARTFLATLKKNNGDHSSVTGGWGTALKPAFEPVVVARKPFPGTVAGNIAAHGTGALNIDGCRIGTGEDVVTFDRTTRDETGGIYDLGTVTSVRLSGQGRWPANAVLDPFTAELVDQQSGNSTSRPGMVSATPGTIYGGGNGLPANISYVPYDDAGGASRFFYTAKAAPSERPRDEHDGTSHPTVKPLELMRWLIRLVTPPKGVVLEPFAGSGTTVEACLMEEMACVAIEREADYIPLIVQRIARAGGKVAVTGNAEDISDIPD